MRAFLPSPILAALLALPAPDLDVEVPPGPALEWARAFPARTPRPEGLAPRSGARDEAPGGAADDAAQRSRSKAPGPRELDRRTDSAFALVRILTWDLAAHVRWVRVRPDRSAGPTSGRAGTLALPEPGDALYWVTMAPLLRLLLHPAVVSREETLAHLVEIGEPTLAVLAAAETEASLKEPIARLRAWIEPARDAASFPLTGTTPRETMLLRFVQEELQGAHPHDPVGTFCGRLFLLGPEGEDLVARYTLHGNALLRRNATVALGRYRTPSAAERLVELAATTEDPVVFVRAAAALGPVQVDVAPLVARLATTEDSLERVVLVGALGRLQATEAVELLVRLGGGYGEDTDLAMAVLTALARIAPRLRGDAGAAADELAARIEQEAGTRPRDFTAPGPGPAYGADRSDPAEARGRILEALATLLRMRLAPHDEERRWRVVELARRGRPDPGTDPRTFVTRRFGQRPLAWLAPPVQPLFLTTLRLTGDVGVALLEQVARSPETDPLLRGIALTELPLELAWGIEAELMEATKEGGGNALVRDAASRDALRLRTLEAAGTLGHPDVVEMAEEILRECAALPAGAGRPEERALGVQALRVLEARGELGVADLLPLLVHPRAARHAHGGLPEELRLDVTELVERAADGAQVREVRGRIDALIDGVIAAGAHADVVEATRRGTRKRILDLLSGVDAHRTDATYLGHVVDAVLQVLLGYDFPRVNTEQGMFAPPVPLEQEILLALGRRRSPQAAELLIQVLGNRRGRFRAVACLALGMTGQEAGAATLATYLLDEDPFVRLCAYEAIRHVTGEDVFVDWMYGKSSERFAAAEEYFRWTRAKPSGR